MPPILTKDQEEAKDKFLRFMLSNEREFYLFGPAGSGKSFLIDQLSQLVCSTEYANARKLLGLPKDNRCAVIAATTNKAAAVLSEFLHMQIDTIFAVFNIRVTEDYDNGTTKLFHERQTEPYEDAVYFIDECSMLSREALSLIRKYAPPTSKLVFIGDNNQLAPVNEKPYWNQTPDFNTAILKTPVRNKDHKALMDLCEQLKQTVITGSFKDIHCTKGVIDHLNNDEVEEVVKTFNAYDDIILSYTNERVDACLKSLKELRPELANERYLINASHYVTLYKPGAFSQDAPSIFPEEHVTLISSRGIASLPDITDVKGGRIRVLRYVIHSSILNGAVVCNVITAKDQQFYLKQFARTKRWRDYFYIKNGTMVLRLPHASTIHKAQGSTFNRVLIDLDSFKACRDPETLARLLYVAVSRAKNHVYLTGSLPKGYGRIL
jgi:hypothetical protein